MQKGIIGISITITKMLCLAGINFSFEPLSCSLIYFYPDGRHEGGG